MKKALVGTLMAALFLSAAGCAALQQMHDNAALAQADDAYDTAHPRNVEPAKLAKVKKVAVASVYAPEEGGVDFGGEWATYSNQTLLDRTESDLVTQLTQIGFDVQPLGKTKSVLSAGFNDAELDVLVKRPSNAGKTKEDLIAQQQKIQAMMDQWKAAVAHANRHRPQEKNQQLLTDRNKETAFRGDGQVWPPVDASSANTFLVQDLRQGFSPHRFVDPDKKGIWSAVLLDTLAAMAKKLEVDGVVLVAEESRPKHGDERSTFFKNGEAPKVSAHLVLGIVDSEGALVFQAMADGESPDPFGTIKGTEFNYTPENLNNGLIAAGSRALTTTTAALKSAAGK